MNNSDAATDFGSNKLILDTHIIIWYTEGIKNLSVQQIALIEQARKNGNLYISTISLWEIAILASKSRIAFTLDVRDWIDRVLNIPGLKLFDLSYEILINSVFLPYYEHKDPADRFILTTARINDSYLMSQDEKIIDYGNKGYVKLTK